MHYGVDVRYKLLSDNGRSAVAGVRLFGENVMRLAGVLALSTLILVLVYCGIALLAPQSWVTWMVSFLAYSGWLVLPVGNGLVAFVIWHLGWFRDKWK